MVMGPTHAVSGAAAWLLGSVVASSSGYLQSGRELAVYTAVCAGAALLPDLDSSGRVLSNAGGATVARSFGVVSLFVAECVEKASLGVYRLTRGRRDPPRRNGHRTFTHTWVFGVGLGLGTAWLAERYGKPPAVAILFVLFGLAVRGLLADTARRSGWIVVTALSALAALGASGLLADDRGYPLLGLAVGAGCVVHTLGDMVTKQGCPILWPLTIDGARWVRIGLPDPIALRAGGRLEKAVVLPLLVLAGAAGAVLSAPGAQGYLAAVLAAGAGP